MFQSCPICSGIGHDERGMVCDVCDGSRIIHTVTGTPGPKRKQQLLSHEQFLIEHPNAHQRLQETLERMESIRNRVPLHPAFKGEPE